MSSVLLVASSAGLRELAEAEEQVRQRFCRAALRTGKTLVEDAQVAIDKVKGENVCENCGRWVGEIQCAICVDCSDLPLLCSACCLKSHFDEVLWVDTVAGLQDALAGAHRALRLDRRLCAVDPQFRDRTRASIAAARVRESASTVTPVASTPTSCPPPRDGTTTALSLVWCCLGLEAEEANERAANMVRVVTEHLCLLLPLVAAANESGWRDAIVCQEAADRHALLTVPVLDAVTRSVATTASRSIIAGALGDSLLRQFSETAATLLSEWNRATLAQHRELQRAAWPWPIDGFEDEQQRHHQIRDLILDERARRAQLCDEENSVFVRRVVFPPAFVRACIQTRLASLQMFEDHMLFSAQIRDDFVNFQSRATAQTLCWKYWVLQQRGLARCETLALQAVEAHRRLALRDEALSTHSNLKTSHLCRIFDAIEQKKRVDSLTQSYFLGLRKLVEWCETRVRDGVVGRRQQTEWARLIRSSQRVPDLPTVLANLSETACPVVVFQQLSDDADLWNARVREAMAALAGGGDDRARDGNHTKQRDGALSTRSPNDLGDSVVPTLSLHWDETEALCPTAVSLVSSLLAPPVHFRNRRLAVNLVETVLVEEKKCHIGQRLIAALLKARQAGRAPNTSSVADEVPHAGSDGDEFGNGAVGVDGTDEGAVDVGHLLATFERRVNAVFVKGLQVSAEALEASRVEAINAAAAAAAEAGLPTKHRKPAVPRTSRATAVRRVDVSDVDLGRETAGSALREAPGVGVRNLLARRQQQRQRSALR